MRLLSLWEPWATLMALGVKTIETRSWNTAYTGPLAIHASAGGLTHPDLWNLCSEPDFKKALAPHVPAFAYLSGGPTRALQRHLVDSFPRGKILCVVNLIEGVRTEKIWDSYPELRAKEEPFGNYEPLRYGWVTGMIGTLKNPIPYKAKQGLNSVAPDVQAQIEEQLGWKF